MSERIRTLLSHAVKTTRGRLALFAIVVAGAMIAGLVLARVFVTPWQTWYFRPLGITVDLPAEPVQTVSAPAEGNAAYECRTREMTVLVAGQRFTDEDEPASLEELAERALKAVQAHPEVTDVRVQTRTSFINGVRGIEIAGTMRRNGAPAQLHGFVVLAPSRGWQVLVFYSDLRKQRDALRIVRSFRRVQEDASS